MNLRNIIKYYKESDSFVAGLARDLIFALIIVVVISFISKIALGLYSPVVVVESESMVPHIQIGDTIFVKSIDRTEIITNKAGKKLDYKSFDEYGDVILYKRRGLEETTPIIHRAMYFVNKSEPMWPGGPLAPHAGYITKGDNSKTNAAFDQQGSISPGLPIKKEWVIGKAIFTRIPLLGCASLIPKGNLACFEG